MILLSKLKIWAVAGLVALVGLGAAAGTVPAVGSRDNPPLQTTSNGNADITLPERAVAARQPAKPPVPKVIEYDGPVDGVAFSPDGTLVAVQARIDSGEGETPLRYKKHTIKVWDTRTGNVVRPLFIEGRSYGVAFAPDGKSVAAVVTKINGQETDNEVRIWGLTDQTETHLSGSKAVWLYEVVFSPDGKTLAAGGVRCDETGHPNGGEVSVWDVATGNLLWQNHDHKDAVRKLAFSADGKRLVTPSDDKTVQVWDAATGKHLTTLPCPDEKWYSAAFSPDGKWIAAGGSDGACVWDAGTGDLKQTFKGYTPHSILIVQFLADGTLVTGGTSEKAEGNLKFWDVKTGKLVKALAEPKNLTLRSMDISHDGKQIAIGTWDKSLVIIPIRK